MPQMQPTLLLKEIAMAVKRVNSRLEFILQITEIADKAIAKNAAAVR